MTDPHLSKKIVPVAVAIIRNAQQELLLAIRPPHVLMPGLWEFPGGKIELNETPGEALIREIREEIGIEISDYSPMMRTEYEFPDRRVILHAFAVHAYVGEPAGLEGQHIEWVPVDKLRSLEFPASNQHIIKTLLEAARGV